MIRIVLAFAALFAGAVGVMALLPTPAHVTQPRPVVAAELRAEATPAADTPHVRVVYPSSSGDTASAPVQPEAPVAVAQPAVASQVPAAPAAAVPAVRPDGQIVPETPSGDPVQAGAAALNLNTASIEALNGLPGGGRIGRTIASHRPYHSVEELLTKRVVRRSVYDQIKDRLAAD
jgi:DNA uptake protein ComE-like DNA-binding protein